MPVIDSITIDNVTYDIQDAAANAAASGALGNFAPAFAEATANAAGSYVTYTDGKLYYLPSGHTANVTWANTTKTAVTVGAELSDLKSAINQISVFHKSKNLLDPNQTMTSGYVDPPSGTINASSSYFTTDYIPVTGGKYAILSTGSAYGEARFIAEFDDAKTVIEAPSSSVEGDGNGTHYNSGYLHLDNDCAYIRITFRTNVTLSAIMLELADTSTYTAFEAYYTPWYEINGNALPPDVAKMEYVEVTDLFSGTTWTDGYVSTTSGSLTPNDGFTASDYVAVTGGKYLVSAYQSGRAQWFLSAQFDADKNIINIAATQGDGHNSDSAYIMLENNTAFVRISYTKTNKTTYGATLKLFENNDHSLDLGEYVIPESELTAVYDYIDDLPNAFETSPLYGKRVSWYGDSILQNDWWKPISVSFNMLSTNNGVGGSKISGTANTSLCQESRITGQYTSGVAIPTNADFIIIGAGTNDWANNVELGEKNIQYNSSWQVVEDVTTFYQACHVMFRRLTTLRPNAKIIVLGTPFGLFVNRDAFTNKYGLLNNQGLTSLDYGNALCDIAEMWGFKALRYGNSMNINTSNAATVLDPNDNGHLHPSTDAAKAMFRNATLNGLLSIRAL